MDLKDGIAAAMLASLGDPRVNVLCIRKPDTTIAEEVLLAIHDAVPAIKFEYWSHLDAVALANRSVQSLTKEILGASDGRSVRGLLTTLYTLASQRSLVPKGIYRNGFFYYLRSLGEHDLTQFIERSGLHGGLRIGPFRTIGTGSERVTFYDNVGPLIERDGFERWLNNRTMPSSPRDRARMIVLAGDCAFPKEIVGLGNWGYTVDLTGELSGEHIERFSPVSLSWSRETTLTAESRSSEEVFGSPVKPETLSAAYSALSALSQRIIERVPYEQIDQRITFGFTQYDAELSKPSPNPILLDCYYDLFSAQIRAEEGTSDVLTGLLKSLSRRHQAAISSSEICRDLDRAARLVAPPESIPERLLSDLLTDLDSAENAQVVDSSVRRAAGELVELEKEPQQDAKKKQLAFSGFVKAMWMAIEKAPDAVKGVEAFRRLLQVAAHLKDYVLNHLGHHL